MVLGGRLCPPAIATVLKMLFAGCATALVVIPDETVTEQRIPAKWGVSPNSVRRRVAEAKPLLEALALKGF